MQRKLYCFAEDWRLICNICGGGDFWRRLVNYRTKDVNVPDAVHRLVDFTTPVHRVRGAGTEFAGSAVSRSGAPPITKKSNGSVTFATRSRELILCYTSSLLFFSFFFGGANNKFLIFRNFYILRGYFSSFANTPPCLQFLRKILIISWSLFESCLN